MVLSTARKHLPSQSHPLTYTGQTLSRENRDFTTREETDELVQGVRHIVIPGVPGERTINSFVAYSSNGQEIARQELSNEETLLPQLRSLLSKVGTAKPHMVPSTAPQASALPGYPLTYTDETRVE